MDAADAVGYSVMQDSDEDYIPQIVDSDIDLQDDDGLFDKTVDCDKGTGKAVQEEADDPTEEVDMCLPSSHEDKDKLIFKSFREEDLTKPQSQVGQTFGSVEFLRKLSKSTAVRRELTLNAPEMIGKDSMPFVKMGALGPCLHHLMGESTAS